MKPTKVISGKVYVLDRADVDTDQIIPAQFMKRIERTGFGQFLFHAWVQAGAVKLEKVPILVAGRNFGCGSSREHAVWAIQDFGFEAVVAPSFADIFYANATKNGLLPVALPEEHVREFASAGKAEIDLGAQTVSFAGRSVRFDIDPDVRHRLLEGLDDIAVTLRHEADIAAFEASGEAQLGPSTAAL